MVPRDLARVNEPTAHRDVRFGSLAGQKRTHLDRDFGPSTKGGRSDLAGCAAPTHFEPIRRFSAPKMH